MPSGLTINQRNILEICERIEMAAGRMYLALAEAHRDDPVMAALWKKTAAEEENHARQFRVAPRLLDSMVDGLRVDIDRAATALQMAESMIEEIAAAPPTPVEALRSAIRLEEFYSKFHMDQVALFRDEVHKKMFEAMMAADRGHVESLKKELARRGGGATP